MDILLTAVGNVITAQNLFFMTVACFFGGGPHGALHL